MCENERAAIVVRGLHKDFTLPQSRNSSFQQSVINIAKKGKKLTQRVLDDISFEVNKGDFFGIVGKNGSGKSTLLKLIAGVYHPTKGHIKIHGSLTPFIELGVGFNPELSGRDNVYLNGVLLGFDRKQINDMYDEIVSFAELGPFMSQKLKNYSSGMQVRLAFSIVIKAKNDILIFDEVLAVGDEAFQRKCFDIFERYKAAGQTVVLVTHDMETVRKFCNRALLIDKGRIAKIGSPGEVADLYSMLNQNFTNREIESRNRKTVKGNAVIKHMACLDSEGNESGVFKVLSTLRFVLDFDDDKNLEAFAINLFKQSGEHITGFRVTLDAIHESRRNGSIVSDIPIKLAVGKYRFVIQKLADNNKPLGALVDGPEFLVVSDTRRGLPDWSGLIDIERSIYTRKNQEGYIQADG